MWHIRRLFNPRAEPTILSPSSFLCPQQLLNIGVTDSHSLYGCDLVYAHSMQLHPSSIDITTAQYNILLLHSIIIATLLMSPGLE